MRATRVLESLVLSDALLVGRMVPRPDQVGLTSPLAKPGKLGAGGMPLLAAKRRPGAAEYRLRPQALGESLSPHPTVSSSPPRSLHSHLINSLPSFSQIYQHLALVRRQTQSQPLLGQTRVSSKGFGELEKGALVGGA